MNSKLVFAAALLAACPLTLHAQADVTPPVASPNAAPLISPAAPAVTLRYKFAAGQVRRYQYDMAMEMLMNTGQAANRAPITMTVQMVMRQTVKSVRPADGAATLVTQIDSVHMLRNGQEMPMPEAQSAKMKQSFTQVMLPTGKLLSMDMPALDGPAMTFKKLFGSITGAMGLPEGPVKIGDTWNGLGASTAMGIEVASTSTLASMDQKNGATIATIHNKQAGTIDQPMTEGVPAGMKMSGQLSGETAQLFDVTAGMLQASQGTSTSDMLMTFGHAGATLPPGMPSSMKMQVQMKFQMQRLSDTPGQ